MDRDDVGDSNVWEFPITDASCLQVTNGEGLANRLGEGTRTGPEASQG